MIDVSVHRILDLFIIGGWGFNATHPFFGTSGASGIRACYPGWRVGTPISKQP